MNIQLFIEPIPGKQFNPSEIQRIFPSNIADKTGGGFLFKGSSNAAIQVSVGREGVTVSGMLDNDVRKDFTPKLGELLRLSNFGRVTKGGAEMPADAVRLLK